jgi:hypothetical protein
MSDLAKRIIELSGRIVEDSALFTSDQAQDVLRSHGFDPVGLTDDIFKMTYDRGVKAGKITPRNKDIIIRAYGVVKHSESAVPEWAKAGGYSGNHEIKTTDYSDANFIKKRIWELSGHAKTPYTLWVFDGKSFSTHLTVFGTPKYLREMTKAMMIYARKSAAIFVTGPSKALILLAIGGFILEQPMALENRSITDPHFVAALPNMLSRIAQQIKDKAPPVAEFKAWFNTKNGKMIEMKPTESFYDPIRQDPKQYGVIDEEMASLTNVRAKMEAKGWAAIGVNAADKNNITAIVQAGDNDKALAASRWLYHQRYEKAPWKKLNVKAQGRTIVLDGHAEILDYLKTGKASYYIG